MGQATTDEPAAGDGDRIGLYQHRVAPEAPGLQHSSLLIGQLRRNEAGLLTGRPWRP
jgi:hypothetical protein